MLINKTIQDMNLFEWKRKINNIDDERLICIDILKLNVVLSELERESKAFELIFTFYNILYKVYREETQKRLTFFTYEIKAKELKEKFAEIDLSLELDVKFLEDIFVEK